MEWFQLAQISRAGIGDGLNMLWFNRRERNQRHVMAALAEKSQPPMRMNVPPIGKKTDSHFLIWLQVEATRR
jgi:hypothetical protein